MTMMKVRCVGWMLVGAMIGLAAGTAGLAAESQPAEGAPKADRALERTRKTVRMLDDIYKSAVVLITDKYVNDESDFAAGSAAIALFNAVKEKNWHEVKLLDVAGEPYNDENVAKDEFEKEAVRQMKAGQAYFDRVERREDGRYLRAATALPVVLEKCIMCHENYRQAKKGEAIGMLSYTLKIE
jgi:hypothetical protein